MAAHSNSTTPHRPYRWVVANATARAALTNSPEPGETSLLTKLLLQSDTRDIYELVDDSPMTWKLVIPGFESASDDDVLTIVSGVPAWAAGGGGGGGADGKTILNGSGAPSNSLGTNGDFYYDPTAKVMYGPKAGGVWPSGVSLAGSNGTNGTNGTNGADGAPGSVWRDGTGAPSNGTGINGDYYLNDANGDVYLRSSGTYSVVANIKGATGATGAAGADGATGASGSNGADGAPGSVWRDGTGAPSNGTGVNGDYYLNDANGDVYLRSGGTYSVVANIKGATGSTGAAGAEGAPGFPGPNGADGADGSTLLSGYGVPSSGTGANGDYYWNLLTADVYSKAGGSWTLSGNINKYRSPTFTRTSGLVSSVAYGDGSTKTITRSGGVITQVDYVASGKTSRRVINRTSGVITSITDSEF